MEQALPQVKVILIGDSGVGKSSILFRFVNDQFNEFSEMTLGAAFASKVHSYGNAKTARFQVGVDLDRFGTQLGRRSTSRSLPSTTEVLSIVVRISYCNLCL